MFFVGERSGRAPPKPSEDSVPSENSSEGARDRLTPAPFWEKAPLDLRLGGHKRLYYNDQRTTIYALRRLMIRSDPKPPSKAMIEDGSGMMGPGIWPLY